MCLLFMPGGWELVVIVFVILLLFGAKKLPELAQGLGKGIKEFKKATTETEDDDKKANSYDEKSEKHSA